ncbi:MAG: ATP-dependent protease ATPase subunit HslU [Firmicutes bacterium]|nr:ATP-dependent protease ATPase subunit HslU [Bacillota bacterium]
MASLTPKKIVEELDKYIIGQNDAKKSVAIALRNRYRRSLLPADMQEEIIPKNILMIGPTGVGKTEIARRLAKLSGAPFIKVEATKYTEVGYVGRDVESMVRDLMEIGIRMVQIRMIADVEGRAKERAIDIIVETLMPKTEKTQMNPFQMILGSLTAPGGQVADDDDEDEEEEIEKTDESAKDKERAELRKKVAAGEMDHIFVQIEIEESNPMETISVFSNAGMEEMGVDFQNILGNMFPKRKTTRNVKIKEAKQIIAQEEARKMIDKDEVKRLALQMVEQHGIIFIDEMDKIAGREKGHGPDVSREGVQRDLLPIVEGSAVVTKHGPVKTNHILFIAAGAFNVSKPSDLIPELQGRFPIRVELKSLGKDDFIRILKEPRNALVKQYKALLKTEGVELEFMESGIEEIARLSQTVNENTENIGARRLHTVMEKLLEEISFASPESGAGKIVIDQEYVKEKLKDIVENRDLSQYIL